MPPKFDPSNTKARKKARAEAIIKKLVAEIGLGFHPDTPAADYDPPLTNPNEYDEAVQDAFDLVGDDVYAIAVREMKVQYPPKFSPGQKVRFIGGPFKGKTGTSSGTTPKGKVLVRINGTVAGPHGKRVSLGTTFEDPKNLEEVY